MNMMPNDDLIKDDGPNHVQGPVSIGGVIYTSGFYNGMVDAGRMPQKIMDEVNKQKAASKEHRKLKVPRVVGGER